MKVHSFRYLVGEGFKNTWVNRLMTLASVGVLVACMVVIGLADLISQNINRALTGLEEQNVVMAFMKDENWFLYGDKNESGGTQNGTATGGATVIANDDDADNLCTEIRKIDHASGCIKISFPADYARKFMPAEEYEKYAALDKKGENVWPRGFLIEKVSVDNAPSTVAAIQQVKGVAAAYYSEKEGGIAVYANDANWAKVHGETVTEEATPDFYITNNEEGQALCDRIKSEIPNVKSVEFISSDKAFDEAVAFMSDGDRKYFEGLKEKGENPISCAAKIAMADMGAFDKTLNAIESMDEIDVVRSHRDLAAKIESLQKGIAVAGIAIMIILILISLMIVSNTIRITMYSRKLEISIMKAVGATNSFIRIPFVVEGVLIGIFSAAVSEAIVYFCYRVATEKISIALGGSVIPFEQAAIRLAGIFLLIGIVAGALGSLFMIRKYLRREGSDFAAI